MKVIIAGIIGAVLVLGIVFLLMSNTLVVDSSEIKIKIPSLTTYKYNSICDLGNTPKEIMMSGLPVVYEIMSGLHNDNKYLINFFKTDELLSTLNLTPNMVFDTKEPSNGSLRSNIDPIFYDSMFFMPTAHKIIGVNPDIIDMLKFHKEDTEISYAETRA